MKNKAKEAEEIKKEIVFNFIRFKATKNDSFKNSALEGLKKLRVYYHARNARKLPECDYIIVLNEFIDMPKGAKNAIDLIYSNLQY